MDRKMVAVRIRDIKKLSQTWGEDRAYAPSHLPALIGRAMASYIGTSNLAASMPAKQAPGRPVGVRGVKQGNGRRSVEDTWIQAELGEAGMWLDVLSEMLQMRHKWKQRPSIAITMAILAGKPPRNPSEWLSTVPRWATAAWLKSCPCVVDYQLELELPIDDYGTIPKGKALDSKCDFIQLTEEQLEEVNRG